jgi:predicted PurR-regulated permease PerM
VISAIIFYLFYEIIIPFFVPICWAGVFAIIFFPLQQRLLKRIKSRGLTSLLMCSLIIILIIGPVTYLFVALVQEATDAIAAVNEWYTSGKLNQLLDINLPLFNEAKEKLAQYYDISKINLDELVKDAVQRVGGVVVNQTRWIITNGTRAIFYFFLMIFAMYYFFRDGESVVNKVKRLMPLTKEQTDTAFTQLRDVIQATMYGGVLIALLQGLLGGLMFLIMGIPSPVFWGAVMAFLSIIPVVGAFVVYIPAGIILIVTGSVVKGIIVLIFGTVVISQVDNVLRPFLISGRTSLHPLLLFFALLGGIAMWGLLGVVMGPIIAAAFMILLKVFEMRLHPEDDITPEIPAAEET